MGGEFLLTKKLLKNKDKDILKLIVESYLKLGKPVSSGYIVKKKGVSISSASVRNIMAKLEENDYLYQPHVSAGRIPTDMGLRFYVNSIFEKVFTTQEQIDFPADSMGLRKGSFSSIFIETSKLLSDYSDNIGFVISPRISSLNFRHLRFIKVSEEKVLIILVTTSNLVINEIIETKSFFTQGELDKAANYINTNFPGKNLLFIREFLVKEVPEYKMRVEDTLQKITDLLQTYLNRDENINQIYLQGTSKFLEKPEMFDMNKLKFLFKSFEEKAKLTKLISDFISFDKVKVIIGSELNFQNISECSLILSHYGDKQQILGSLGIIGPKRIPYKKIIPLVDCVAKRLSQTISFAS